jgi:ribonuclease PH
MPEWKRLDDLTAPLARAQNRAADQLRPVTITPDYIPSALGSVLIECGRTRVICVASLEQKLPRWMMDEKERTGWVTAEYSLLPYAGGDRKMREATAGKVTGRTQEIQRLIGRALRAAVTLKDVGDNTIWIDCDVIEADGGTRTAAVTGGYLALHLAAQRLLRQRLLRKSPMLRRVAAVSVGMVNGTALLDLDYSEDSSAAVDFNVVMTDAGAFVEIQGTAEEQPFTPGQLSDMLTLAQKGCQELFAIQDKTLRALNL